jgi:RHS repeat-associated protein
VQDFAYLSDRWGKDLGNNERIYGEHRGAVTSKWVNVPADGYVDIRFWAASPDNPDWGGAKTGVVVDGYEYQRYEAGATPVWTPLRMPGQYHDAETDLFENWNRFYDPSIGRYFQPDPLAYDPGFTGAQLSSGLNTLTYSYANNNPIGFTDPEGKFAFAIGIAACAGGGCEALIAGAIAGAAAGATVTVAYIAAKLNAIFSENQKDADKPSSEEAPTNENTEGSKNPENTEENKNTNPYSGPVDRPVIVVDESGNAIPVAEGEQIVGSPNGDYQQILGPDGKPTGLRIDRGGHKNQKDPRARGPHGHVPGVTLPDGNPHLPIRH